MPTGSAEHIKQKGFTYIGLLVAVVLFGLGSVGGARILASAERAEREEELLFIGEQFRQAIRSYFHTGAGAARYPASLQDLLQDKRFPTPRRHLRRLYVDPITGTPDWGWVMAPEGGIMGVYSKSEREPQRRANFSQEQAHFAAALQKPVAAVTGALPSSTTLASEPQLYSYRDWKFIYRPK